jgi:hypothetical protein
MSSTMIQGTVTPEAPAKDRPLTAHDRCAGCGAQAFVRVETESLGEFLFCGHHWTKSEVPLNLATPFTYVHDERHLLLPKPFDPATDNC